MNVGSRFINFLKKYKAIFVNAGNGFADDKVTKLSAALAYNTLFSIAPMIMLIVIIGSSFYSGDAVEGRVFHWLRDFVGEQVALQIQDVISNINLQRKSTLTTIISIIAVVIGATGTFAEIQDSLNMIWGVRAKAKKGIVKVILSRLISFSMVIGLGFLLIVTLMINTVFLALSNVLLSHLPNLRVEIITLINNGFLFVVLSFLFAVIFKMLPDVKIRWRQVLSGSLLTAALFMLGKYLIMLYVSNSNTVSLFGAAGALIILLLWVYFSAFILYFGAEFTRAYIEHGGEKIIPTSFAEYSDKRLLQDYIKRQEEERG